MSIANITWGGGRHFKSGDKRNNASNANSAQMLSQWQRFSVIKGFHLLTLKPPWLPNHERDYTGTLGASVHKCLNSKTTISANNVISLLHTIATLIEFQPVVYQIHVQVQPITYCWNKIPAFSTTGYSFY